MKKKLIATLTSVAMVATMVPATALAADSAPPADKAKAAVSEPADETPSAKTTRLIEAIKVVANTPAKGQAIKDAEAAYNALNDYDRQAYDNANKNLVKRLKNSRTAYDNYGKVLSAAETAIAQIPAKLVFADFSTDAPKGAIQLAKEAIGAFEDLKTNGGTIDDNTDAKVEYLAGGDDYKLNDASKKKYDLTQVEALKTAIDLVDKVDPAEYKDSMYKDDANPDSWSKAKAAIANLPSDNAAAMKAMIKNLSRVTAIDQAKKQDQEAVRDVQTLISVLEITVDESNAVAQQKAYDNAKAAFDKLSENLQGGISSARLVKLEGALREFNKTQTSNQTAKAEAALVIEKIRKLPEALKITLDDEAAVKAADAAYKAANSEVKKLVDKELINANTTAPDWLEAAKKAINFLNESLQTEDRAQKTINLIKALPTPASAVTRDYEAVAKTAMEDYNAIAPTGEKIKEDGNVEGAADSTQKLVTNRDLLVASLQQIERLKAADKAAATEVVKKYPDKMEVKDEETLIKAKNAVAEAEIAYNGADKWVQVEINAGFAAQRNNLEATRKAIKDHEEGLSNGKAAAAIISQMKALPAADKITAATLPQYLSQVRAAETAYTTAIETVKAKVAEDTAAVNYYEAALNKVNTLEAAAKVPAIVDAIENLKVLKADGTETEASIDSARAANKAARDNYKALPVAQKAEVTNLDHLEIAEGSEIPAQQRLIKDEAGKIGVTIDSLTAEQIAAINNTTRLIEKYFGPVAVEKNITDAFGKALVEKDDYVDGKVKLDKQNTAKAEAEAAPIISAIQAISSMFIDKTNADYVVNVYNNYQGLSEAAKKLVDEKKTIVGPPVVTAKTIIESAYAKAKLLVLDLAKITPIADQVYTGSAIVPKTEVKDANGVVIPASEYNVYVSSNVNAGTATVTILPTIDGRYTGTAKATFKIQTASVSQTAVSAIASQTYTGGQIKPAIKVTDSGRTLVNGKDYTISYGSNTNKGAGTVTITGKGNYSGTKAMRFTINARSVSSASVAGAATTRTYTGKQIRPSIKVVVVGRTLVNGRDYTISYGSNTNKGAGTVTITGKGNYAGAKATRFTINAKSLYGASVAGATTTRTYTGKQIRPYIKVVAAGRTLRNGSDYTVSYGNNTYTGKGAVKITARGNYAGTISKSFRIIPAKESITSLKAGKGKLTVKFKKQSGAYYQIHYYAKGVKAKTYRTKSTSKTISKLKRGRVYAVKVRAYKIIDGKYYYGAYSKARSIKTKR